jgi:hypothetical protein
MATERVQLDLIEIQLTGNAPVKLAESSKPAPAPTPVDAVELSAEDEKMLELSGADRAAFIAARKLEQAGGGWSRG